MEALQALLLFGLMAFAFLVPFAVVPEIMGRKGYNPRSWAVRRVVWITFLVIVFAPALASGLLLTVRNPADWGILIAALVVAILYDYYRLNPDKVPWGRPKT
jgi:hypothetical protein